MDTAQRFIKGQAAGGIVMGTAFVAAGESPLEDPVEDRTPFTLQDFLRAVQQTREHVQDLADLTSRILSNLADLTPIIS